jgi:alanine racemase
MTKPLVWADVDLGAYGRNIAALERHARPGCRLMAVVKADAYGHGAVEISRRAVASGVEMLGVARFEEGVELRDAGIEAPILVFGHTPPDLAELLVDHRLTQTVWSLATATALSTRATAKKARLPVHVKIDTGMGRLGLVAAGGRADSTSLKAPAALLEEIRAIAALEGLHLEGLYTHFASADEADKSPTANQLASFVDLVSRLRSSGLEVSRVHAANSAAFLALPDSHLGLARLGISTYGLLPSSAVRAEGVELQSVLELKTRIIQLKQVPAGFVVSYGSTWRAPEPTAIATVAIGYADGLNRQLSSRGEMLVCGRRAPIVGRVCMDLTMLDVGHIPEARLGDEAVVIGEQGEEVIGADEIAARTGTINYEVLTSIAVRVPRFYRD